MITLKRIALTDNGTFGVLLDGESPFALTAERPWSANKRGISCIPRGWYTCRRVRSPRFGETFEVTEVPGRTHILFHKGNTPADTRGCILIGSFFGALNESVAVLSSTKAFNEFLERLKGKTEFILSIEEV
jgi:hypothetical protein